ncbi:tRNA (adenosine(37)-N6)-threonylcarbamoyltransferase complex ATPase subunit type 1 TsaE [Larkinella punicea]|uniref:tRNA threonylcarbamoyladenosine biosynthesis protein TsaE n=1 Tax=Larkinella punicea TaxID=2315727 RepID=A0A368JKA8_9BACT|nr:tRNA (adenosine(37)-N6)-threonylcarbamoyltransferase complex ATPase subunit type 1 TsaE [Larkinella punicea]RCR66551.1 tRNA (adenosine(37)-N6)-threonylcarbamoyltransferase complex ATPase subunit type 1 TsaE [Larkinella punicea]
MILRFQSLAELDDVAGQLIDAGRPHSVWLFDGEMGAGKTTLIKAICRRLGVMNVVQSPTFSIVNEYITNSGEPVYHFDCYRLRNEEEALDSGLEEYIDSGERCFIEWPERIAGLLPPDAWTLHLRVEEGERILETN